ncbi:unnamed protein product [Closterium sp. NIES-65]|nr:unnamed protein product [Closterium sp. NIES-65]
MLLLPLLLRFALRPSPTALIAVRPSAPLSPYRSARPRAALRVRASHSRRPTEIRRRRRASGKSTKSLPTGRLTIKEYKYGFLLRHFATLFRCVIWLCHSAAPFRCAISPSVITRSFLPLELTHLSARFSIAGAATDESFDLQVTAEVTELPEPPVGIVIGKGKFGSNTGVSWYINKPWSGGGGSYKLDFKLTAIEKIKPRGGSGTILEVLQAVDKGVVSDYYTAVLTKSARKSGGLVGGGFVKGFPNILPMFSC